MPGARLSLEEREEIASGRSLTGIARGVGRPVSTVSREVARIGMLTPDEFETRHRTIAAA